MNVTLQKVGQKNYWCYGCFNLFCNVWLRVYVLVLSRVGVLIIRVLVFTVFCIVCTVFLYCFVYVYYLFCLY